MTLILSLVAPVFDMMILVQKFACFLSSCERHANSFGLLWVGIVEILDHRRQEMQGGHTLAEPKYH